MTIIREELEEIINIAEEQQGFRKNRSTINPIFMVRQRVEKSLEFNHPLFLCFVDFNKTFDRVRNNSILKLLNKHSVPSTLIELIDNINTNTLTKIKTTQGITESIMIDKGIRQGD